MKTEKNNSILKGIGFGLTSGVITTLGMLVGLSSAAPGSRSVVVSGILIIAIADAMSDALGVHISEESEGRHHKTVWITTITTFLAKFFFALSFVFPILFFDLDLAVKVSVIWGLLLIGSFSYYMGKKEKSKPIHAVIEHLFIAILVIALTHWVGDAVAKIFAN